MAQIVGGFGVPHTPVFPHFVKRDGPDCEIAKLFGAQKERACGGAAGRHRDVRHRPSQYLLPRRLPIFALGVDKTFKAPNDEPRDVPNYVVPSAPDLAAHIRAGRDRGRLRCRHDAELLGRSFGHRAAAFPDPGHEDPGDAVLHQRACAAAALGAALLRARPGGRPRHRGVAGEQARRGDGLAAASRSRSAARAWRPAAPTACPIRTGRCG